MKFLQPMVDYVDIMTGGNYARMTPERRAQLTELAERMKAACALVPQTVVFAHELAATVEHNHKPFNVFALMNHERLVDESARRFGWYSERQATDNGAAIWNTPDGKWVVVTAVYDRAGVPSYSGYFSESVFVGEVVECVLGSTKQ